MTKLTKDIERRLALLDALEAGGVGNWEGYDFATEEYSKTIGREEAAEDIIEEICCVLCEYIEQPAGAGCGFGFAPKSLDAAVEILLRRLGELK
jgi:hypothetical protein